ncbi:MAG: hypothetical protein D8M59_07245 [Planctomycetes bacterium]|nr:hypothetical protein [Planctomycetota bacterium]
MCMVPTVRSGRSLRAFTMIEMLVVIGLVVVLGSLTLVIGSAIISQGKARNTEAILANLDAALTEYEAETGSNPMWTGKGSDVSNKRRMYQPASGYSRGGTIRPEVAVFLADAKGIEGVDNIIRAIPPDRLMQRVDLYEQLRLDGVESIAGMVPATDTRLTVCDAWGMEILYVHPRNTEQNPDISVGDGAAEVYGATVNNRPYFMSAGADLLYANQLTDDDRDDKAAWDNLYSYEVPDRPGVE